jgi:hypothetical protein
VTRAPKVLTVVLIDTTRTVSAIVHENEWKPYSKRTVQIELTPEQRAQLEPRVIASWPLGDEYEEVLSCWLEPTEAES